MPTYAITVVFHVKANDGKWARQILNDILLDSTVGNYSDIKKVLMDLDYTEVKGE